MIKRAMISGISSTGVDVADLRVIPAAVARHLVKSQGYDAGFHVGLSPSDPEVIRLQFFEPPGIEMTATLQKEVEKHFSRGELRRVAASEVGRISYPARVRETYAAELLSTIDVGAVRERGFRIVVDYGFSGASYVLPLVLGPLGVELVAAHAFPGEGGSDADRAPGLAASIGQTKRLVPAVAADLGAVFDRSAERLHLVDEQAREVPVDQALLLFLRLIGSNGRSGRLAFPVTVTSQVDRLVDGSGLEIIRTPASLPELTKAAAENDVVFGGGRAARDDARPPSAAVPVGPQGARDARPQRAARRPGARPHRRDQAVRRARLGPGAAGSRRAAHPPLRRGRDARRLGGARAGAAGARRGDRAGRSRGSANVDVGCAKAKVQVHPR
jgi:mannose-1-phosphate guanylyltransferase/phosphomannomutase